MWNKFFQRLLSISTFYFFATFCARIKGGDNAISRPEWFVHYLKQYLLLPGWSVCLVKNSDQGLENAALALR